MVLDKASISTSCCNTTLFEFWSETTAIQKDKRVNLGLEGTGISFTFYSSEPASQWYCLRLIVPLGNSGCETRINGYLIGMRSLRNVSLSEFQTRLLADIWLFRVLRSA